MAANETLTMNDRSLTFEAEQTLLEVAEYKACAVRVEKIGDASALG